MIFSKDLTARQSPNRKVNQEVVVSVELGYPDSIVLPMMRTKTPIWIVPPSIPLRPRLLHLERLLTTTKFVRKRILSPIRRPLTLLTVTKKRISRWESPECLKKPTKADYLTTQMMTHVKSSRKTSTSFVLHSHLYHRPKSNRFRSSWHKMQNLVASVYKTTLAISVSSSLASVCCWLLPRYPTSNLPQGGRARL